MNKKDPPDLIRFFSPMGWIVISASPQGICGLDFHGQQRPNGLETGESFQRQPTDLDPTSKSTDSLLQSAKAAVIEYLSRATPLPGFPLDVQTGTDFQKAVWKALCTIPFGQTRSYLEIAEQIGRPKSYRAVGQACGKNPIALIVPCHRVIAHDGSIGGYGGGLQIKKALLALEKAGFP